MNRLEYGEQYACQVPGGCAVPIGESIAYMLSTPARMGIFSPVRERTEVIVLKYGTDEILWREGQINPDPDPNPGNIEQRLSSLERQVAANRLKLGKIESWIDSY
jgi:hypothetical protein